MKEYKYHCFNHHVQYEFMDNPNQQAISKSSNNNLKSTVLNGDESIEVPELIDVLEQIIYCYTVLDKYLARNYNSVNNKLAQFEKQV